MKIKSIKKIIPWYIKFTIKILLSFLPNKEKFFRFLGIYKLGYMKDSNYSLGVFNSHLEYSGFKPKDSVILEIGPGDSVSIGIIAWSMGAQKSYLLDNGNYATQDINVYKELIQTLIMSGYERAKSLENCNHFNELIEKTNIVYLINGLESLRELQSNSIDYCFSQAALEHIFLNEFQSFISELYRVQKSGSLCSHVVDLKDHLGESLNSLRFNTGFWESNLIKRSGFYTNRLRCGKLKKIFQKSGFMIAKIKLYKWDKLPLQKKYLSKDFKYLGDEELKIKGMFIFCRK